MQLHYARAQELAPYLDMAAAQGEVYVQFWLSEGDPPVEVSVGKDMPEGIIPAELKPYL